MALTTPGAKNHEGLAKLASRYVDVEGLPWVKTRWPGVEIKVLMEDKETGLLTALTRFAPGATLPDHEGVATTGNFVWRPAGNRHSAHAKDGCVALSFFLKPNKFFD